MRKEWILTDEEKSIKRQKIVRNRLIKQQALLGLPPKTVDVVQTNIKTSEVSFQVHKTSTGCCFYALYYNMKIFTVKSISVLCA